MDAGGGAVAIARVDDSPQDPPQPSSVPRRRSNGVRARSHSVPALQLYVEPAPSEPAGGCPGASAGDLALGEEPASAAPRLSTTPPPAHRMADVVPLMV